MYYFFFFKLTFGSVNPHLHSTKLYKNNYPFTEIGMQISFWLLDYLLSSLAWKKNYSFRLCLVNWNSWISSFNLYGACMQKFTIEQMKQTFFRTIKIFILLLYGMKLQQNLFTLVSKCLLFTCIFCLVSLIHSQLFDHCINVAMYEI